MYKANKKTDNYIYIYIYIYLFFIYIYIYIYRLSIVIHIIDNKINFGKP